MLPGLFFEQTELRQTDGDLRLLASGELVCRISGFYGHQQLRCMCCLCPSPCRALLKRFGLIKDVVHSMQRNGPEFILNRLEAFKPRDGTQTDHTSQTRITPSHTPCQFRSGNHHGVSRRLCCISKAPRFSLHRCSSIS